jgi:hypothetical protein
MASTMEVAKIGSICLGSQGGAAANRYNLFSKHINKTSLKLLSVIQGRGKYDITRSVYPKTRLLNVISFNYIHNSSVVVKMAVTITVAKVLDKVASMEQHILETNAGKQAVLGYHRFLINSGVEKMNNISIKIKTLTTRCL